MSDPFVGEIRLFPFTFAPRGWALCNGQILKISQHTALFSLIGTMYGGNGTVNFGLPDLRGRVAVSSGQGPGLSTYDVGQVGGSERVSLTGAQMPSHFHEMPVTGEPSSTHTPSNQFLARVSTGTAYAGTPDGTTLNSDAIARSGGGQAHENRPPHLALNYCIALEGIFPSPD